ncbi:hypothetical protein ENSA5_36850 [Enhygromyxa salina]|uniref:Uncharacterized protein n=1 Tax=Enhygromyxa salina TaxID=215803 RepID=A0A2S9XSJ3_9BACT|nr:hypothetical protein [Enhygromyxa salina]PRP95816.1 hypothetical protein ENSA5_36850 [Enhygromyxa salina]
MRASDEVRAAAARTLGSKLALPWTRAWPALTLLSFTLACPKKAPDPGAAAEAEAGQPSTVRSPRGELDDQAIEPAAVTPLEVLYLAEPEGEGYAQVPIKFGPSLHSGKWLGLANGDASFMGPKHVIVNHFRSRPDHLGEGELINNVLLDVETGEVVAEFEYGRYVQWHYGLAIVFKQGDEQPYLLDAESGELVLAIPAGTHDYVYGENYWLRFSPIAKRVWIYAQDGEDTVHLYEWEELGAPPELPNNPFPFLPEFWDPMYSDGRSLADHEEVQPKDRYWNDCPRAILKPPKGYECLDEDIEETLPLTDGWRLDVAHNWVFNRRDGRAADLSGLCPEADPAFSHILSRAPARVRVTCGEDPDVWMLWTPPDRVRRLDAEYARQVNAAELRTYFHGDTGRVVLKSPNPPDTQTEFDPKTLTRELIGTDYACSDLNFRAASKSSVYGIGCKRDGGRWIWFELVDTDQKLRSRFQATEMVVGQNDVAVAIVRRGGIDRVVRLGVRSR